MFDKLRKKFGFNRLVVPKPSPTKPTTRPKPQEKLTMPNKPSRSNTGFKLSNKSKQKMKGVHPQLQAVVELALTKYTTQDFTVLEGLRSEADQRKYVKAGTSQTMNSKHRVGRAVDIIPYGVKDIWDWQYYYPIAKAMKAAAHELGVPIVWGGDWKSLKDGPHFELHSSVR